MVAIYGDTLERLSSVSPMGRGGHMSGADCIVSAKPGCVLAVHDDVRPKSNFGVTLERRIFFSVQTGSAVGGKGRGPWQTR